jgi:lipoic acid synthetase
MGLRYVVVTSVTRDDLPDGGAGHFAATIRAVRSMLPQAGIEVLTPDFKGEAIALSLVIEAAPDVFNHNIETVPRLYPTVRPQAVYHRSLQLITAAKEMAPERLTKSGLMVGLGETIDEIVAVFRDLRSAGCDMLTIGQYLRPTKKSLPVVEYREPGQFDELRRRALELGFRAVASGPLVRSSMNAEEMFEKKL